MMSEMYQTYLKSCNCENGGIIIIKGRAICRWCRRRYGKGGMISYSPEHFNIGRSVYLYDRIYIDVEEGLPCTEGKDLDDITTDLNSYYFYLSEHDFYLMEGPHKFNDYQTVVESVDYELKSIDKQVRYENGEWAREFETKIYAVAK